MSRGTESLIFGNQRSAVRALHGRPRGCKLGNVFTALALLLIVVIAFATGFEPQFNGPFAIAAVVLLFLGAITDSVWRRFRRR
jgi:uncharacterized membrane protein YoaK (UPF0700 family)